MVKFIGPLQKQSLGQHQRVEVALCTVVLSKSSTLRFTVLRITVYGLLTLPWEVTTSYYYALPMSVGILLLSYNRKYTVVAFINLHFFAIFT